MLYHAKIARVEDICSSVVFVHGEIFSRSFFFHKGVFPSAGMCAHTLVCLTARHKRGKKASAGVGYTHGAVHKCLYFGVFRYAFSYALYLGKRKLPCTYYSFGTEPVPEIKGGAVGVIGLGRDMQLHFGHDALCGHEHSGVGYQNRVRSDGS